VPLLTRVLKLIAYMAAAIYFVADALFVTVARPISRWFAARFPLPRVRAWIKSLPPYPCLALFSVPVILLEPVKMIAAYMAATGQFVSATATFVIGEILKLVLVERLFELTKNKLMKIPVFAWAYGHYARAKAWLKQTEAWKAICALSRSIRERIGGFWAAAFRQHASRQFH
jgi:hypothetical protein